MASIRRAPAVTQVDDIRTPASHAEHSEATRWIRANWVTLAAAWLILAQLAVASLALAHAYFRQDDFLLFDWALRSQFSWQFIGTTYGGHFMPGGLALTWALSRISVYDWTLASMVNLVLLAGSGLALLRLLRTLFGARPAILIPLTAYLFSPILLPGLAFWATTLQWLPLQLAVFMALNAHVVYVRTGRLRHAIAAAAWIVFGLLFDEVSVFIPVLLLALTSGYLVSGGWARAAAYALRKFWRAWVMYAVLAAGYLLLFVHQLSTSSQQPTRPGLFSNVLTFTSTLLRVSFIPAALGGPWHWLAVGTLGSKPDYAFAAELPPLTQISWSIAALIILASLWYRRHAWRAWIILACWILASAVVPLVVGRIGMGVSAKLLGEDLHSLADSAPVIAICLGLAFWPVTGEGDVYRARPRPLLRRAGTAIVLGGFLVGSGWSYYRYETGTSSAVTKSYIATARVAVAAIPKGAVLADTPVPTAVETYSWFGPYAYTERVLGALAAPSQQLAWTRTPNGIVDNLKIFDSSGRLWGAAILGRSAHPSAARHGCWLVGYRPVRLPIPGARLYNWTWTMGLSYYGPAATMAVQFAAKTYQYQLPAGLHMLYVPATGGGSSVHVQIIGGGPKVCVTSMTIGGLVPSILSHPTPAKPVRG